MAKNYGHIVIGPPGSGKTSFCNSMAHFLLCDQKTPVLINLDPGVNEQRSRFKIDICQIVFSHEISTELHLGPNGSIIYSMEYLDKNLDWFEKRMKKLEGSFSDLYFFFDLPGQIELFTHHIAIRNLIKRVKKFKIRLVAIILIDFIYWKDRSIVFSVLTTCISIMLNMELPFVNLLSKIDLFFSKKVTHCAEFKAFQNFMFEDIFLRSSIFFWANKFYKNLNDIIFDFSPLITFFVNIFDKKDIQKISETVNSTFFDEKKET